MLCLVHTIPSLAFELELAPTVGYRFDKLVTSWAQTANNASGVLEDTFSYPSLHLAEIGIQGKLWMTPHLYVRGEAKYGSLLSGRYNYLSQSCKTNGGESWNVDFAAGCLADLGTHFRIGPEAGWSYDYLSVRIPKTNGGLNNKNYWESPWIGFAAQFLYEEWSLTTGYQYHWACWEGKWNDGQYRFEVNDDDAHGNFIYANLDYSFFSYLNVGFEVNYRAFKAKNKTRFVTQTNQPGTRTDSSSWNSLGMKAILTYTF